jgi:hypothetical protein
MQANEGKVPLDITPSHSIVAEFADFSVRLDLRSSSMLHLEILEGDNKGFKDDVAYELHWLRQDVAVLSWRETIGTTVTHVIDLAASRTYATVTPAKGGFLRLEGRLVQV